MKVCTLPILSEWSLLDILLRVNAEEPHGTAPLRWECQVWVYRLTKPPYRSNRYGAGRWVVSWECHISAPGTPILCHNRTLTPRVVFASGASDRLQRTRTRSYFVWCLPGGCCLIPTLGRTLFPAWADTRTASFRALGHTGFVTTGPTLLYVPFWKKNVWELPL